MNILLIGGLSYDDPDATLDKFYTFVKDTLGSEHVVYVTPLDKLSFTAEQSGLRLYDLDNAIDVGETIDAVFIRGPKMRLNSAYAYYVSRFCKNNNIRCINSYSLYYPGTKFAQSIVFMEHNAPFLKTLYCIDNQRLINIAEKELGIPYVLKTNVGSHGDSNYLIRSVDQAEAAIRAEPDVDFIAQAYCPNDRDYRLLVVGDSELVFERRGVADSHLNNTSKGAVATEVSGVLPPEICEKALEVAHHLGLEVAGVDVMPQLDTSDYYFLEINSQPQLRTGALLDRKKALLRDLFAHKD